MTQPPLGQIIDTLIVMTIYLHNVVGIEDKAHQKEFLAQIDKEYNAMPESSKYLVREEYLPIGLKLFGNF